MPLVLFDLDGTLVDSAPDLCASLNRIRRSENLAPLPYNVLREYAGSGARGLLKIGFDITDQDPRFPELKERFLSDYQNHCAEKVCCFDGIEQTLEEIEQAGWQWGVVTNKFSNFTVPIMKKLGLYDRACVIISGDETGKLKPHPDNMLVALNKMRALPQETPYVGDDIRDSKVAQTLGMPFAAATWGYLRQDFPIDEWHTHLVAHHPQELIGWLKVLPAK
ncbi:HAD family hydrolase [Parasutterella secunda]|jgi:2-phosphoglycolate phosphatase|uniref:HAD family hydrolase n=1 Tax=Parasutterella secunda TaxID=626947 RepID=UPI0025A41689|nr:HAD hydrolase-like protein [Parasutterella secunda]MDM8112486.1 HAD hydrolase-like protein [Parasutterella secunda]MDM8217388.1 HAD hydrolase-like protein [Parasutterella secunda]MDM8226712.1 HAD hydrolase-like protein [Parasutterella secunda]HJI93659.1 HAD hydrolase-like protein [Sutterellaceae bacterium]